MKCGMRNAECGIKVNVKRLLGFDFDVYSAFRIPHSALLILLLLSTAIFINAGAAKKHNAYGQKHYTVESAHFRIHYHRGLEHLTPRVANKLEQLYQIYTETYHITLPKKTEVVLYESEIPDGFAYPNFNFIYVGVHDYEYNLRGSSDWFDDVLTHEYAHVVSINTGLKLPPAITAIQAGSFTHPNAAVRFEGLHLFPSETMPVWFIEGIAQYESGRRGSDSWDSHRDMILRTLTLSGKTLSWPHIQVFAGKGDDYEKVYNHGFSLIMYIADTYGYDKVVSILRENARVARLSFDGSVKAVLGISAKQLYYDWQESLSRKYKAQIKNVGTQVYGRKINEDGYDNGYPMFSPDGKKIFFVSNADNDYSFRSLYSYNMSDSVDEKKKIKYEMHITGNYDIHPASGKIAFVSMKSRKSRQAPERGGQKTFDLFIDTLPPEKSKFFRRKTEKQVTTQKSVFAASFSPDGGKLACAVRKFDRFFLAIADTSGNDTRIVYPQVNSADEFFKSYKLPEGSDSTSFSTIFSLSWSPGGKDIAVDYIDGDKRKIGVYDTLQKTFSVIMNSGHDQRDPSFNRDGTALYFSSDETGIFNVYRYTFKSGKLDKLTNVSGGAFHPAVSDDGKKLVYTGYDRDGYGIYLLDSIKTLHTNMIAAEDAITPREPSEPKTYSTPLSNISKYSHIPRQAFIVPTFLAGQRLTAYDDESGGDNTYIKGGLVLNLMDPLAWSDIGNEGGAFLLVDLSRVLDFIDFDKGLISPYASYDAGMFFMSRVLPIDLSGEVTVLGIAGDDWFYEESEGEMWRMPYKIQLTNALLETSYPLPGGLHAHLFAGIDRYDVALDLQAYGPFGVFSYNLSKGYRAGAMAWFAAMDRNSRYNISPTGLAGKVQYNLWQQRSLKEENSFSVKSSLMKEQYDDYLFHQIDGRLLFGRSSPIHSKHDLHLALAGSCLIPIGNRDIPSFYLPAAMVPGYAFYYKDEKSRIEYGDTTTMIYDTVLVTGKSVITGQLSYRFPLWPGSIDKKLSFLYFDKFYGALNLSAGAGFDNPGDALNFNRADWLVSYGAELRLEAISFNNYPLALKFSWDYGADRSTPEVFADNREVTLGGHRFTFSVGFSFDDWGAIPIVDYFTPARWKASPSIRFNK